MRKYETIVGCLYSVLDFDNDFVYIVDKTYPCNHEYFKISHVDYNIFKKFNFEV